MTNKSSLKMAGFNVTPTGRFCPTDDNPIRHVTEEDIRARLKDLAGLLKRRTDKIPALRQELKNLFPDRLTVAQEEAKGGFMFKASGKFYPFKGLNLPASTMSYSGAGT